MKNSTKPAQYSIKTDAVLDRIFQVDLESGDLLDLAMACLDQAGLSVSQQERVRAVLGAFSPEFVAQ